MVKGTNIAAMGFVGCPAPPPENTIKEVYDMIWINSDETEDWFLGEDFSTEITIVAPAGDYTFKFYFKDSGGNPVFGRKASGELSLTIE